MLKILPLASSFHSADQVRDTVQEIASKLSAHRLPHRLLEEGGDAPNALLIYSGTQFPAAYREGAFLAFHGSWNRAPAPQGGYNVVFQPLANGATAGNYVVFADGFAGKEKAPGRAA